MDTVERVDGYQRHHGWLGLPLAIVYKFFEDQGGYLAAIITYYGFLSLFPLLLLFVTVLGFALQGNQHLQDRLLHSALAQFPIVGGQLQASSHSLTGSGLGLAVGVVAALYGGLGVVQAGQNAFNRAWGVPRQDRPNPFSSRVRSLVLLPILGGATALSAALSGLSTSAVGFLGPGARVAGTALLTAADIGLFIVAFRLLTARKLSLRDVLPGAVVAGVCWQALLSVGTYVFLHALRGAGDLAGTFGVALGLLVWIYVEAVITVFCAQINVVVARRLWPRAILALFADTEALTPADRQAYTSYARLERYKTFQQITVEFVPKAADGAPPAPTRDRPRAG